MHLPDGVVSLPVIATGTAVTVGGLYIGIKKLEYEDIPKAAILGSAFFVASLIHVPIGFSSAHLILNGLLGAFLGPGAFCVIFIGLLLQALFFGFGGLSVLGVNTAIFAVPALICGWMSNKLLKFFNRKKKKREEVFSKGKNRGKSMTTFWIGFTTGSSAIILSCILYALAFIFSNPRFLSIGIAVIIAHIPIMIVEGIITGFAISYIQNVSPQYLPHNAVMKVSSIFIIFFLMGNSISYAHKIKIFAAYSGEKIKGYVYVSGGAKLKNVPVTVKGDGKKLKIIRTNGNGKFSYTPPMEKNINKFNFSVDFGDGHYAEYQIAALKPLNSISSDSSNKYKERERDSNQYKKETKSLTDPNSKQTYISLSPEELKRIIADSVSNEVYPLREQLSEYEDKVRFHDILGGIGFIFGFCGIASWFLLKRQGKRNE